MVLTASLNLYFYMKCVTEYFTHFINIYFEQIMLGCCATCLLLNVHFLNCALGHFDALFIVPAFQAIFITFSVAGGLIFYKEWTSFGIASWVRTFFTYIILI